MDTKTDLELRNFFIFNSQLGLKEGEEQKKILYYHPISDNVDVQIKNVGLVEGIIQFTGTFKPSAPVRALHTEKSQQLYFQPEPNYWMAMTLDVPVLTKLKDGSTTTEYLEHDVQDNVYEAVLAQAYEMYRLFWGTFQQTAENDDVGMLKTRLEHFYKAYLKSLKLAHCDILNIFSGIQYLPLDKVTFLKVQCFINQLECNYSNIVEYTAFLYNDYLIWSGVEPSDMKTIYQYLIGTLLPANVESELQGGSIPRNSSSFRKYFVNTPVRHGHFITGPPDLKNAKGVGKVPKVYLFGGEKTSTCYYMVVYRALSASVCLFIKGDIDLNLDLFKQLDDYISPKLTSIVTEIADYCVKQLITPSNIPENAPRFIYFNKLNLAYKSTAHLDNKQSGNIACPKESLKIIADLNCKRDLLGHSGETIVKTMNDYWVVSKTSNLREFYIALQQKNASLIDISEEIKKLCDTELKGIFFHPM